MSYPCDKFLGRHLCTILFCFFTGKHNRFCDVLTFVVFSFFFMSLLLLLISLWSFPIKVSPNSVYIFCSRGDEKDFICSSAAPDCQLTLLYLTNKGNAIIWAETPWIVLLQPHVSTQLSLNTRELHTSEAQAAQSGLDCEKLWWQTHQLQHKVMISSRGA